MDYPGDEIPTRSVQHSNHAEIFGSWFAVAAHLCHIIRGTLPLTVVLPCGEVLW